MNKARRKRIDEVVMKLTEISEELRGIADEEQDYYDCMPENLQGSEKGEAASQAAEDLTQAADDLENTISTLTDVCNV